MAGVKISNLPAATVPLTGAELIAVVQGGATKQVAINQTTTGSNLVNYLPAGTGAVTTTVQTKLRENVSVKDFGAVGNGSTNDRSAIVAAQTAVAGSTLVFTPGTYLISSNLTITANCQFQAGAILVPASGVTITLTGSIVAGTYKIFEVSTLKHVNCTSAKVSYAPVEWWGVVGGDATFSAGNAAINKPLIDEVLTYGPRYIHWTQPGIYSTTGHRMNEPFHVMIGLGMDSADSAVVGSGILFTDNAFMVSQGATFAGKRYVFFNGSGDGLPGFENMRIIGSDLDVVIPYGILPSSTEVLQWWGYAETCNFKGYVGKHIGWGNWNEWRNCLFQGKFACVAHTIWNDTDLSGNAGYVQKQHYITCIHSQTQNASGYVFYQDRVGDASATGSAISGNKWTACVFEYGFNGLNLTGKNQTFDTCHIENLSGTTIVSGESNVYDSLWINPDAYTGAGTLANDDIELFKDLGTRSTLTPFAGSQVLALAGCTTVPTSTVIWTVIPGDVRMVTLDVQSVGGTSNATTKSLAALPAYLWPQEEEFLMYFASDNGGAYVPAQGRLSTAGVMTFYATAGVGAWTASGTCTISGFSLSYPLDY